MRSLFCLVLLVSAIGCQKADPLQACTPAAAGLTQAAPVAWKPLTPLLSQNFKLIQGETYGDQSFHTEEIQKLPPGFLQKLDQGRQGFYAEVKNTQELEQLFLMDLYRQKEKEGTLPKAEQPSFEESRLVVLSLLESTPTFHDISFVVDDGKTLTIGVSTSHGCQGVRSREVVQTLGLLLPKSDRPLSFFFCKDTSPDCPGNLP